MNHKSHITYNNLVIGTFFCQLSSKFNQLIFVLFSLKIIYDSPLVQLNEFNLLNVAVVCVSILMFFFLATTFLLIYSSLFSAYVAVRSKGILGVHEFEFHEDEFVEKTAYNETRIKYQSIRKVFTRLGSIYIYLPGIGWHFLPKSDFDGEKERRDLIVFLEGKLAVVKS